MRENETVELRKYKYSFQRVPPGMREYYSLKYKMESGAGRLKARLTPQWVRRVKFSTNQLVLVLSFGSLGLMFYAAKLD